jgi:N-dimethylarginine dimethylaminohydrolase
MLANRATEVKEVTASKRFGGHSMVAPLQRVLVWSPAAAGWIDPGRRAAWKELGYRREPDPARAESEHARLRELLAEHGVELLALGEGAASLDAVYCHDASLLTHEGAICLRMGKPARMDEPAAHERFYRSAGIPVVGRIEAPGTVEAGDLVWLDPTTILAGRGYRTNRRGVEQLRALLQPQGVEVLEAPLPHGDGPSSCLHLMSLLSLIDDQTALVDLPLLAVPTVELLRERGFDLVEIAAEERATMAANVLALGGRRLLALAENPRTIARLRSRGFAVAPLEGSEIAQNGGGGPTCLTRPILRG